MNKHLEQQLKYLHLGVLQKSWDEYLLLAAKKRLSHAKFLEYIIENEYQAKMANAQLLRVRRARIPTPYALSTFPFERQPKLNKKKIFAIYDSSTYLANGQNIIWLGVTGCGKTGLATSFLLQAISQGYTGRYILFADLVNELNRSIADLSQSKVLKEYSKIDCLLIDEIGYVETEPAQVGLFFTLMQKRHKKKSTLITTNLGFADWRSFLKNEHLTAALIDRLTENSHVFNMKQCISLRERLSEDT